MMLGVEDHEIINIINKEVLKKYKSVHDFCKQNDFRHATVYDFLNNQSSIRASTLFKMLDCLDLTVGKKEKE